MKCKVLTCPREAEHEHMVTGSIHGLGQIELKTNLCDECWKALAGLGKKDYSIGAKTAVKDDKPS